MYKHGLGVPQDYFLAEQWLKEAAEQGDWYALYDRGILYGDDLRQEDKANYYLKRAVEIRQKNAN